jgi:hypothetical protein
MQIIPVRVLVENDVEARRLDARLDRHHSSVGWDSLGKSWHGANRQPECLSPFQMLELLSNA